MRKKDSIKKLIYGDCAKSMNKCVLLHIAEGIITGLLSVLAAQKLGEFANAVFEFNVDFGLKNVAILLLCILISILVVPVISLIGNIVMLKHSLIHDRIILGRFLDKTYEEAMKIDESEAQFRLEDDACDFRIWWEMILTRLFTTPVILFYVLFNSVRVNPSFALCLIVISVLKLIVPITVKKIETRYDKETREYTTQVRNYETEITKNSCSVKLFGLSNGLTRRLDNIYYEYYNKIFCKSIKCMAIAHSVSSYLDTFCVIIILLVGAAMTAQGMITAGAVAAMLGYFSVFNTVIGNIDFIVRKVPLMKNIAERMRVLYDGIESLSGCEFGNFLPISAENLSFSYGDKVVFNDLNFNITSGNKAAVCGKNGSGKSTLIKLLCGFVKGYKGCLRLGDVELSSVKIEDWRRQLAYAPQNPYMFSGTVEENICLGDLNAKDEVVHEMMKELEIEYLANREVSFDQNDLSGGERQKISIARALLKNSPILILDEPNNNLDEKTRIWLQNFIGKSQKTIFYVSHDSDLENLADIKINLI